MVPHDVPVDNVFGGELMALCHETQKEDRHPSLSGSGVLGSALRHMAGVLGGVAHSLSWRWVVPAKVLSGGDIHVPDFTANPPV